MEAKVDVTKRKDLSDFYRNFYTSNSGFGADAQASESHPDTEPKEAGKNKDNPSVSEEAQEAQQAENSTMPQQEEQLSAYEQLRLKAEHTNLGTKRNVDNREPQDMQGGLQSSSDSQVKSSIQEGDESSKVGGKPSVHGNNEDRVAAAKARYLSRKRKNVSE